MSVRDMAFGRGERADRPARYRSSVAAPGLNAITSSGAVPPAARRELLMTVGVAAIGWILLSHSVLLPLRWLITLVHESSHATAVVLLGGSVNSVTINPHGGGLTYYRGNLGTASLLLIASAGYLGTAVVGAVMLELCQRLRRGRAALAMLAVLVVLIGLAWVPWTTNPSGVAQSSTASGSGDGRFTILFVVLAVAILMGLGAQPSFRIRRIAVVVIATTLCLAAVDDLRNVVNLSRRGLHSDAAIAAQLTPLPSWFWAILWLIVGVAACALGVWSIIARPRKVAASQ